MLAAMIMNFEMLRAFCAVIDHGGFRAAAKALGRTQPAISQQVKALETSVGQPLLDRRSARPTAAGLRLLPEMRAVLRGAENLRQHAGDLAEGHAAVLRVGTSDTTALYTLPEVVQCFTQSWPTTRLELVNRSTAALAGMVLEGRLDVAVVTLPVAQPGLTEETLFEQELVLAAPAEHPLTRKKKVQAEDLADSPMLLLDPETRTGARIAAWLAEQEVAPQVIVDSGSFEVLKRYVAAGVGLAILPRVVISDQDVALRALALPGLPAVPIGALWRREGYRLRAAEAFIALLRSQDGQLPRKKKPGPSAQ